MKEEYTKKIKKLAIYIVAIGLSLITFQIIFRLSEKHDNAIFEQQEEEFPTLRKSDSCDCRITLIHDETAGGLSIRNNPNGALISCRNKRKLSVYTSSLELNSKKSFDDVLQAGGTILKKASNDTIYVLNPAKIERYQFLISK